MNDLQKIMKLFADSAKLETAAYKMGEKYTKKNCPYKKGMRLVIRPHYGQEENAIIESVGFNQHGELKGMARLCVMPMSKAWQPKFRRNRIWIKHEDEILNVVK